MKYSNTFFLIMLFVSCGGDDSTETIVNPATSILEISNINDFGAEVSVSVQTNNENPITEKGIVWSTSSNPTLTDNVLSSGSGANNFTSTIQGLDGNSLYNVRSYIVVENQTVYSLNQTFSTTNSCEQNVFVGSIDLYTQQDVNEFGSNNYCRITGALYITNFGNPDPILDLSPLNALEKLFTISIRNNPGLTSFDGLENLRTVEGVIQISANEDLLEIDALRNVTSSVKALSAVNNPSLQNIDGFLGITKITSSEGRGIYLSSNTSLMSLSGLSNVASLEGGIEITENNNLLSLNGLQGVSTISDGRLNLRNNNSLKDLIGLENLTSVNQGVIVTDLNSLISTNGLNMLSNVGESLSIYDNESLENIEALNNLKVVGETIYIEENINLLNLNGLENLSQVGRNLIIENNLELVNLCGITNLVSQDGILEDYIVFDNAYNPSQQDILDGNCSQ